MLKQRFDREKRYRRTDFPKLFDPRQPMLLVLNAYTPPDMCSIGSNFEFGAQQMIHALGPLRQNLVCVPICGQHDAANTLDKGVRNVWVKEVAHRVHKDSLWSRPPDGIS